MALKPGSRLGPYEVTDLLGAGGMGEVYRAHDPRLDRDVAIKVLPEENADDDRLRRFEQEARAASLLNHPNILTVFDVGTHDGGPYVVSELLEGQTLRERLAGGALPVRKVVDHAGQIARGLAAAHERGIVHRDLKPENLFLTAGGHVKILDFGLAKLQRPHEGRPNGTTEATASWKTDHGTRLGTAGYMSPEQVRGEQVDHRSDIFSFGAVLYEMLSGRRAFRRDSAVETMNAILTEDPPELSGVSRAVPPALERIIQRCLEKRREDRFHSAHDLDLAFEVFSSGISRPSGVIGPRGRRLSRLGGLAALVALVAAVGLWIAWPSAPPPPPLRIRPITTDPGQEMDPALSPDGNQLAYAKLRDGRQDLFVKLIDGGDQLLVSQGPVHSIAPAWSPDGRQIAFLRPVEGRAGEIATGVFVVPALGGAPRQLATSRGQSWLGLAWSPDRNTLAIADTESSDEPGAIFLLSYETGERRRLTSPPAGYVGDTFPRFSPDGRTLAFVRVVWPFDDDIYVVPVSGGEERRLTVGNLSTVGMDWAADGKSIVFSSWRQGGADVVSLWRAPVTGGDPEPLGFGESGRWPTISRGSGRLAYVQREDKDDIWRVGGPAAPEGEHSPTRLISSTRREYHARYSPDGTQIVFGSLRSGAGEIWICDADGSNPHQLTFLDRPLSIFPSWSPDGQRIAFTSWSVGHVYVVSVSGGVPRQLTTGHSHEVASSWSRDGRWVYFHSHQTGSREVWKVPPDGGDAIQVTTQGGTWAFESTDGRFVYFAKSAAQMGPPGIWRIPTDGGEELQVLDRGRNLHWAPLEHGIVFLDRGSMPPTLEFFDFAAREVTRVVELDVPPGAPGFSVSPDGRWVLYTGKERAEADIMLVENFE